MEPRERGVVNRIGQIVALAFVLALGGCSGDPNRIVIGSKNFTEQVILGELLAQHIENQTDLTVDRRLNLGGTFICHEAIAAGQLDLYVEYTGTALAAILEEPPQNDPEGVLARVRDVYRDRFEIEWTEPLGFSNTFAIIVRGNDARALGLSAISDLVPHTSEWIPGFGYEFAERQDGYRGLVDAYGLEFSTAPRDMDLGLVYQALAEGEVDLIAGNSTDGLIDVLDLQILEDDLEYFPPYDAVPVVREETLEAHPELRDVLAMLGGMISEEEMRAMNYRVDAGSESPRAVAREFLAREGP